MMNSFLVNAQRTGTITIAKPLRLTTVEEHQIDHESLKTWERIIKDVTRYFSRFLSGMTGKDVTAQLLKLEPTSEEGAIERLGGSAATASALYLYANAPNCVSGCIMLALHLEFTKLLTRHMRTQVLEESVQAEVPDPHQASNVLGYSLASAVTELCSARSQLSPPVIMIDTVRTIVEIARKETSGRQDNSQFLVGVTGITVSSNHFKGTFVLCCPASLLGEYRTASSAEPTSKHTALHVPAFRS